MDTDDGKWNIHSKYLQVLFQFVDKNSIKCNVVGMICCCSMAILCFLSLAGLAMFIHAETNVTQLQIGDSLANSSALITANSSVSQLIVRDMSPGCLVYKTAAIPPIITDKLVPKYLSASYTSSLRQHFNYLGEMKPIYLLSGSIIHYNVSITSTQRLSASHSACLYLFENVSQFETFITDTYSLEQIIDSHCFTPAVTREPTLASHSFTISNAGQYYVAIELQNSVMVKANASVVRVYYNTEGLSAYCSNTSECQIEICHKFLCSHSSTNYIVVHAPAEGNIQYDLTTAAMYGAKYGLFCTFIAFGSFFCCCCCWCYCFLLLISCAYILDDSDETFEGRRYSQLNESTDDFIQSETPPQQQLSMQRNNSRIEPHPMSLLEPEHQENIRNVNFLSFANINRNTSDHNKIGDLSFSDALSRRDFQLENFSADSQSELQVIHRNTQERSDDKITLAEGIID